VVPTGWVNVLPVPVATNSTVAPCIGLLFPSRAVTVIVLVSPSAVIVVGAATTVDCPADTAAAVTVTVAVCVTVMPPIVADTVLTSATVELNVPVATPLASVGPGGWARLLSVPVAAKTTVAPSVGLLLASRAVTVIVLDAPPAVIVVGAATTVD